MPPRRSNYTQAQVDQLIADALLAERRRSESAETPPNTSVVKPCTYKDFLSCHPLNFKGTEGAIGLLRWLEKTESVFRICNCPEDSKVKFSTYTFMDDALTWWNTYADSVGQDIAIQTPWDELKKMLKDEYCPRDEIQQLEAEFWQLTTQGNDIAGYTSRFNQLAHLCPSMVSEESKRIERYIWGLPSQIQGMVTSSNSTTFHGTVRMAHKLMAQIVRQGTSVVKTTGNHSGDNKRKLDGNPNNQGQNNKKPAITKANTSGSGSEDKKEYTGTKPYCSKCKRHHDGPCGTPCDKCQRYGHASKDCRAKACYACGEVGHYRSECPILKGNSTAKGRFFVLQTRDTQGNTDTGMFTCTK